MLKSSCQSKLFRPSLVTCNTRKPEPLFGPTLDQLDLTKCDLPSKSLGPGAKIELGQMRAGSKGHATHMTNRFIQDTSAKIAFNLLWVGDKS